MNFRKLLLPFSLLYGIGAGLRNIMFNTGMMKSTSFPIPIINVGNLSVGGTGKTPHIMYLIGLLKDEYMVATLSRGYGRKTSGFKIANYETKVYDIGDEPMSFFKRFKNRILITVCEDRVYGVKNILNDFKVDLILLDDAYQHRFIKPGFNVLLTDYSHLYTKDYLLPAGNLREPRKGAVRADVIIVTKCPDDLSEKEVKDIYQSIKPKSYQKLFFSKIVYEPFVQGRDSTIFFNDWKKINVILVTGIANANSLVEYAKANFNAVLHLEYPDHYNFSSSDIDYIKKRYKSTEGDKIILTTEKDYMRLDEETAINQNLYYLPIKIEINDSVGFNETILNYVRKNKISS